MKDDMDKGIDELIAAVQSIEIDNFQGQPMNLGQLISGAADRKMNSLHEEVTKAYYEAIVDILSGSSLKDMTILSPHGRFEVLEVIYARGCLPNQQGRATFKKVIKKFADYFGFNVELTDK